MLAFQNTAYVKLCRRWSWVWLLWLSVMPCQCTFQYFVLCRYVIAHWSTHFLMVYLESSQFLLTLDKTSIKYFLHGVMWTPVTVFLSQHEEGSPANDIISVHLLKKLTNYSGFYQVLLLCHCFRSLQQLGSPVIFTPALVSGSLRLEIWHLEGKISKM